MSSSFSTTAVLFVAPKATAILAKSCGLAASFQLLQTSHTNVAKTYASTTALLPLRPQLSKGIVDMNHPRSGSLIHATSRLFVAGMCASETTSGHGFEPCIASHQS